jgi:hypothetical protein
VHTNDELLTNFDVVLFATCCVLLLQHCATAGTHVKNGPLGTGILWNYFSDACIFCMSTTLLCMGLSYCLRRLMRESDEWDVAEADWSEHVDYEVINHCEEHPPLIVHGKPSEQSLATRDTISNVLSNNDHHLVKCFFTTVWTGDQEHSRGSSVEVQRKPRFHVHIGLNPLTCGFILPSLRAIDFAVIESPTGDCAALREAAQKALEHKIDSSLPSLSIRVNGKQAVPNLTLLTRVEDMMYCNCLTPPRSSSKAWLVLSESGRLIRHMLQRATSLSCAMQGEDLLRVLPPLLHELEDKPANRQPVLYVFEAELRAALDIAVQGAFKVYTVPCLADR